MCFIPFQLIAGLLLLPTIFGAFQNNDWWIPDPIRITAYVIVGMGFVVSLIPILQSANSGYNILSVPIVFLLLGLPLFGSYLIFDVYKNQGLKPASQGLFRLGHFLLISSSFVAIAAFLVLYEILPGNLPAL